MTPEQRRAARETFQGLRKLPPEKQHELRERWLHRQEEQQQRAPYGPPQYQSGERQRYGPPESRPPQYQGGERPQYQGGERQGPRPAEPSYRQRGEGSREPRNR